MKRILSENQLKSIIWLHDGMYINKEVPTEKAAQAIADAAEESLAEPRPTVGHNISVPFLFLAHRLTVESIEDRTHYM